MQLIKTEDEKIIEVTASDVLEFIDKAQVGMCLQCGTKHYDVDPDGELYECDVCDHMAVFGHQKLQDMGMLRTID